MSFSSATTTTTTTISFIYSVVRALKHEWFSWTWNELIQKKVLRKYVSSTNVERLDSDDGIVSYNHMTEEIISLRLCLDCEQCYVQFELMLSCTSLCVINTAKHQLSFVLCWEQANFKVIFSLHSSAVNEHAFAIFSVTQ